MFQLTSCRKLYFYSSSGNGQRFGSCMAFRIVRRNTWKVLSCSPCAAVTQEATYSMLTTLVKQKLLKLSHYACLAVLFFFFVAWLKRCSYTARGAHPNRFCGPICWRISVSETFLWLWWHGGNESRQLLGCRLAVAKGDEGLEWVVGLELWN